MEKSLINVCFNVFLIVLKKYFFFYFCSLKVGFAKKVCLNAGFCGAKKLEIKIKEKLEEFYSDIHCSVNCEL